MKIHYQVAKSIHLHWLAENDTYISKDQLSKKIATKEIIVALNEDEVIGWLRFGLFWDSIPFINLLFLMEDYRNMGIGRNLVQFWEKKMLDSFPSSILMTSSQSNENGQHFFRKIGYHDAGALNLPKEPIEIIFIKEFV